LLYSELLLIERGGVTTDDVYVFVVRLMTVAGAAKREEPLLYLGVYLLLLLIERDGVTTGGRLYTFVVRLIVCEGTTVRTVREELPLLYLGGDV